MDTHPARYPLLLKYQGHPKSRSPRNNLVVKATARTTPHHFAGTVVVGAPGLPVGHRSTHWTLSSFEPLPYVCSIKSELIG